MDDQPMKVTSVISRAITTWFDHFIGFFVLALVLTLPIIPLELAPLFADGDATLLNATGGFVRAIAGYLLTGVVVFTVYQSLNEESGPLTESVRSVVPHLPWLVVAAIVLPMIFTAGFLACIIPGIYLALALAVVIPTIVVEETDFFSALKRSFDLTKGQKVQIFLIYLVYLLILGFVSLVTAIFITVIMGTGPSVTVEVMESGDVSTGAVLTAMVADHIADAIIMPLQATLTAVVYFDLRQICDETDLDDVLFPPVDDPAAPGGDASGDTWTDPTDRPDISDDRPDGDNGESSDVADRSHVWGDEPDGNDDDGPKW